MIDRVLSRISSVGRMSLVCASVVALSVGCHRTQPLAGQVSVVAELAADDGCGEGTPPVFEGLELRALGESASWSIAGRDIMAGRGQRELPAGLYTVSMPPPDEARGGAPSPGLMLLDAPMVSVLPSQVTTISVRGVRSRCSLSLRP